MAETSRILFTGEFDQSDITRGIDSMINSLQKAKEKQAALNDELNANKNLANEAAQGVQNYKDQIATLEKSVTSYSGKNKQLSDENKRLNETLKQLTEQYNRYAAKVAENQKQIEALTQQIDQYEAAMKKGKRAVEDLQETTSKPITPSLDGTVVNDDLQKIIDQANGMTTEVGKRVQTARATLSQLIQVQQRYKQETIEINGAIKANNREFAAMEKELDKLIASGQGASKEAVQLRSDIAALTQNTQQLKNELKSAETNLQRTTVAVKTHAAEVKRAETAGNAFASGARRTYSGLRLIANIIPGLGIASLIGIISGPLIQAFTDWFNKLSDTELAMKRLKDVVEGAGSSYQKAVVEVTSLRQEIDLAKQGFLDKDEVVKHYNETLGKTTGQVKSLDEAERELAANAQAYVQMTLYKAAANIALEKASQKAFDAIVEGRRDLEEFNNSALDAQQSFNIRSEDEAKRAEARVRQMREERRQSRVDAAKKEQNDLLSIADAFNKAAAQISKEFNFSFFPSKAETEKKVQEVKNIYEQELLKLQSDLAKITEKGFTDESSIQAAIEADFKKRDAAFQKAFRNKQLTEGQLRSLQENLSNLQKLTLSKALDDFNRQKQDYLRKINDEITALQFEESKKRIEALEDSFDKERQLIEVETDKAIRSLEEKRDKLIADVLKNAAKNGLTPEDLRAQLDEIKRTYSQLIDDLQVVREQKIQKLAFDTFQSLSADLQKSLEQARDNISREGLIDIRALTEQLQSGRISFDQYQKQLTRITKEESDKRVELEIANLRKLIRIRESEIMVNSDKYTEAQRNQLLDEIQKYQKQLNDLERGQATQTDGAKGNNKIQQLQDYASLVSDLAHSVADAWMTANEAEQRALDRSIAMQERRVEAARRIAEQGNSEYLRMEEDRERKLLIQKENAARRQMAINAAIQASQLMVGITGAIAKIAEPGVGIFEAIASIGVIAGALLSGFALVKSLTSNQPSFFVGTEDTGPGGNVDDKGGFHAILHPRERVIDAEQNKKLKGLSNKEVVQIVEMYKTKREPLLNYDLMDKASEQTVTHDARLANILNENKQELKLNNELQMKTHKLLRNLGVSVNVDKNGIAVSVLEAATELQKIKKS